MKALLLLDRPHYHCLCWSRRRRRRKSKGGGRAEAGIERKVDEGRRYSRVKRSRKEEEEGKKQGRER